MAQLDQIALPDTLSDLLVAFNRLSPPNRSKFLRAAGWAQVAAAMWDIHTSSWFTALISAIEALVGSERGEPVTRAFVNFVEEYSPTSTKKTRDAIYATRSAISHGSRLLHLDEAPWDFAIDRTYLEEHEARDKVATVARDVLVNWLLSPNTPDRRQAGSIAAIAKQLLSWLREPAGARPWGLRTRRSSRGGPA